MTSATPGSTHRLMSATLILAFGTAGAAESHVTIEKVRIASNIYLFSTAADGYVPNGNSVVIINDEDVLVFDTFTRPSSARVVLTEIRHLTDKPVRYVVNSHWHPDHWSGNEVYAREFPEAEFVSTEESVRLMRNFSNAWPAMFAAHLRDDEVAFDAEVRTGRSPDGSPLTAARRTADERKLQLERDCTRELLAVHRIFPTLTYRNELTLRRGSREFRLIEMVGDARGSTVLYLPQERILITGDVVSFPVPYFTPPLSEHARSLRALRDMDAEVIVPGHGPAWHDKTYLNLELALFDLIIDQVHTAVGSGLVTVEEVRKSVDVSNLRPRFTHDDPELDGKFRRYVDRMIENAYREARDDKELEY